MFPHSLLERLKAHRKWSGKHNNNPDGDARQRIVAVALALDGEQTGRALEEEVDKRRMPRTADRIRKAQSRGYSKSGSENPKVSGGGGKGERNLGA